MKKETLYFVIAFVVIFVGSVSISVLTQNAQEAVGSVQIANEYHSTTTPLRSYTAGVPVTLQAGQGTLGSVVITSNLGGGLWFYDATTTDISKRTGNKATSTLAVMFNSASSTPGTYTFDVIFYDGLIVQASSSPLVSPEATITWR